MIDHILVFKNMDTQYEVLHYFRKSFCKALEELGVRTTLLDITSAKGSLQQLIYRHPPDFIFGFNAPRPYAPGCFLANDFEIPQVTWLVDSAHHFKEMADCPFHILFSPDKTSAEIFKTWGLSHSYFLPHGFDKSVVTEVQKDRPYPITFLGSLIDYLAIEEEWKKLPDDLHSKLMICADEVLSTPTISFQQAYANHIPIHSCDIINSLDLYVRGKERIEQLKKLKSFPVHIFGNQLGKRSWADFLDLKKGHYVIHPSVNFDEAIKIMQNRQFILNSSPMFKYGAHERIFYGLGSGACVITNQTPWILENFQENELLFSSNEDHIHHLLNHAKEREALAYLGQQKALKNHTWEIRAKEFLSILEKALY